MLADVKIMTSARLPLALVTVAASAALLAGCSAPASTPTTPASGDQLADASGLSGLKAEIPTDVTETAPPAAPDAGQLPDGYSLVTDQTGALSVVLPDAWSQVDGAPFATSDGREWASIIATTDSAAYPSDWTVAGIEFSGTAVDGPLDADTQTAFLTQLSTPLDQNCTAGKTAQPYDDGLYKGYFSNWENCGGSGTFGIVVVAQDPQAKQFVFLRGKFVTDEEKDVAFTQIFTTFQSTQGLDKASTGDRAFVPGS